MKDDDHNDFANDLHHLRGLGDAPPPSPWGRISATELDRALDEAMAIPPMTAQERARLLGLITSASTSSPSLLDRGRRWFSALREYRPSWSVSLAGSVAAATIATFAARSAVTPAFADATNEWSVIPEAQHLVAGPEPIPTCLQPTADGSLRFTLRPRRTVASTEQELVVFAQRTDVIDDGLPRRIHEDHSHNGIFTVSLDATQLGPGQWQLRPVISAPGQCGEYDDLDDDCVEAAPFCISVPASEAP